MNAPARASTLVVTLTVDDLEALVDRVLERRVEALRPQAEEPILLTCSRLCRRLGVSRATVYRWRKEGMPAVRCGDDHRYELGPVLEWIRGRA